MSLQSNRRKRSPTTLTSGCLTEAFGAITTGEFASSARAVLRRLHQHGRPMIIEDLDRPRALLLPINEAVLIDIAADVLANIALRRVRRKAKERGVAKMSQGRIGKIVEDVRRRRHPKGSQSVRKTKSKDR